MEIIVPKPDAIATMLESLLGREVYVTPGDPGETAYAGRYIGQGDELAAVGLADMALVAYAGSALSMVPPATAKDVAASGDPTEPMVENLHEVLNVSASLLIDAGSDHVRLDGIKPAEALDADTAELIASGTVTGFTVDIDGYGKGSLAFVTTG